jgi:hypothetical protein
MMAVAIRDKLKQDGTESINLHNVMAFVVIANEEALKHVMMEMMIQAMVVVAHVISKQAMNALVPEK